MFCSSINRSLVLFLALFSLFSASQAAWAQVSASFACPAGGRQGTTVEVLVGGRQLYNAHAAFVSGNGVTAKVIATYPTIRIYDGEERRLIQFWLNEASRSHGFKNYQDFNNNFFREPRTGPDAPKTGHPVALPSPAPPAPPAPAIPPLPPGPDGKEHPDAKPPVLDTIEPEKVVLKHALLARVKEQRRIEEMRRFIYEHFIDRPRPPQSPAINQVLLLEVTIAPDAEPGDRELRILSSGGLSRPLTFQVGTLPEYLELEPNEMPFAAIAEPLELPVVINGQIREADVDCFRFRAKAGQKLTLTARGRDLVPFMADAVPGWFQPVITLYDEHGNEVAYSDRGGIRPDPILYFDVPRDGIWTVEIHDSLFRGREDFTYRLMIGELPWVEGIFPLGGDPSKPFEIHCVGRNLPNKPVTIAPRTDGAATGTFQKIGDVPLLLPIRYKLDSLPTRREADIRPEETLNAPILIDGRIESARQIDRFRFTGKAGQDIVLDVSARTLGSPLDAVLFLFDPGGKPLASADDREELNVGRLTHQADPYLRVTLPVDGVYEARIADTAERGGPSYAYRLRISPPRPDFEIYMLPSGRVLWQGQKVPVTFHLIRRDGFTGTVQPRLLEPTHGFKLDVKPIPENEVTITGQLIAPTKDWNAAPPVALRLDGMAKPGEQEMIRPVIFADDHEQAFIYHHFVPADPLFSSPNYLKPPPEKKPEEKKPEEKKP